jgi:hypothetical protein
MPTTASVSDSEPRRRLSNEESIEQLQQRLANRNVYAFRVVESGTVIWGWETWIKASSQGLHRRRCCSLVARTIVGMRHSAGSPTPRHLAIRRELVTYAQLAANIRGAGKCQRRLLNSKVQAGAEPMS